MTTFFLISFEFARPADGQYACRSLSAGQPRLRDDEQPVCRPGARERRWTTFVVNGRSGSGQSRTGVSVIADRSWLAAFNQRLSRSPRERGSQP